MNEQDLKNSILHLAVQGKLVDQIEEEGMAKELLEQIINEKKELMKEKKIKKEKALSEITMDEIPFDIPNHWEWVKFGQLVNYTIGKTPQRSIDKYWGNDHYWVSIADMIPDSYIDETKEKISNIGLTERFNGNLVSKGTLLMSFKLTIGRVSILNIDAVHNEAIISIYPYCDSDDIIKKYLFKILTLMSAYGDTKGAIKGKTLNSTSLSNLLIPVPPLGEQKRIVAKIEELMPYAEKYGEAYSKVDSLNKKFPEDMQKSILQYAILGKLVEQREEEGLAEELYKQIQDEKKKLIEEKKIRKEKLLPPITEEERIFDIPEGWIWVRLGSIISVRGGKRIPVGRALVDHDTGYKYIRISDMENGSVSLDKIKYIPEDIHEKIKAYKISKDDVYITVAGTIGQVGIVPEELSGSNLTENANKLIIYSNYKKYIYYMLCSPLIQNQITNATTKVGQPKLAIKRIQTLIVPLPPLEEQKRIVAKIEEILPHAKQLVK